MTAHRPRPLATGITVACGTFALALFAIGWVPPVFGRGDPFYLAWAISIAASVLSLVAAAFAIRERRLSALVGVAGALAVLGYFVIAAHDINSF